MIKKLVSLFLVFSFSAVAHGDDSFEQEDNLRTFNYIYQLCAPLNSPGSDFYATRDHIIDSVKHGFNSVMSLDIRETPISRSLKELVNSPGYDQAMKKCFGNSKVDRFVFSYVFIMDDVLGQVLGATTIVGSFFLLKKLSASQWAKLHPRFMRYTNGSLVLAGVAGVGLQGYELKSQIDQENEIKKHPELLIKMIQEKDKSIIDDSYAIVQARLDEITAELAKPGHDGPRMDYLMGKKAQLEQIMKQRDDSPPAVSPR